MRKNYKYSLPPNQQAFLIQPTDDPNSPLNISHRSRPRRKLLAHPQDLQAFTLSPLGHTRRRSQGTSFVILRSRPTVTRISTLREIYHAERMRMASDE
jgi:hypothetical protein